MYSIAINNQIYNYIIARSHKKRLSLKVTSANSFQVTSPYLVPELFISNFISKNQLWIQKVAKNFPTYPDISLLKTITILDEPHPMLPEKKLKQLARVLISDELERLCIQFKFTYNKLALKNQKTRFGSCSSKNNLNFNWQCIFFPKIIFRHLLLHELVHTQIKNHSSDFWNRLTQVDPDTKKNNVWLKKNGTKHYLFDPSS